MGQCNCNGGPAPFIPLKKKENKEIKEKEQRNGDKILNKVHLLILLGILLIIYLLINRDCQ
jgi:hypothetical protein